MLYVVFYALLVYNINILEEEKMNNEQQNTNSLVREKSAMYPSITIEESYEFIKLIDGIGGKIVSYSMVLEKLGLTNPTTKSFINKVSTTKQFGFITTGSSTIQLTESAISILYPTGDENNLHKILVEAFEKPPLYAKLIKELDGKEMPNKEKLSNILMAQYRIIKSVKDNAANCFIKSAEYLGLVKSGVLFIKSDDEYQNKSSDTNSFLDNQVTNRNIEPTLETSNSQSKGYNFEIPTLSKAVASFYIPDTITEKDIDYIALYIKNMVPVFLENLKAEIKKE